MICASVCKEDKKNGSKLRPCHLILSALNHAESDARNACTVTELCLRKEKIFSERNKMITKDSLFFSAFFICQLNSALSISHKYTPLNTALFLTAQKFMQYAIQGNYNIKNFVCQLYLTIFCVTGVYLFAFFKIFRMIWYKVIVISNF